MQHVTFEVLSRANITLTGDTWHNSAQGHSIAAYLMSETAMTKADVIKRGLPLNSELVLLPRLSLEPRALPEAATPEAPHTPGGPPDMVHGEPGSEPVLARLAASPSAGSRRGSPRRAEAAVPPADGTVNGMVFMLEGKMTMEELELEHFWNLGTMRCSRLMVLPAGGGLSIPVCEGAECVCVWGRVCGAGPGSPHSQTKHPPPTHVHHYSIIPL